MAEKKKDTDYLYLSAYLRSRESRMLTREKMEQMLDAAGFEEAAKLAFDSGCPDVSGMDASEIDSALAAYRASVFEEIARMAPDKGVCDVFRMKYDYHNAKVLVKSEAMGSDGKHLLSEAGRVPSSVLADAYYRESFISVPPVLARAMTEAKSVLARTGNPQTSDIVLDRAYFAEILAVAKKLESLFLRQYAETLIDSANLRTAVRTLRMGKDMEFLKNALISGGSVGAERLAAAAVSGDGIASVFTSPAFAGAAKLGSEAASAAEGPLTGFELACDNAVTEFLQRARIKGFGEEVVIAYMAAFETEITALRMILTGKLSGIAPGVIKERLRDSYA